MDLDFTEEQTLLRSTVHRLCEEQVDARHVRAMEADAAGFSPAFWGALGELGLCGMRVPEAFDGSALGLLEAAIVHEEFGRCLAPSPHLQSAVQSARLLALCGTEAQQAAWLAPIACGERIVVPAWQEPARSADIARCEVSLSATATGWQLNGVKTLVPFALAAHAVLVMAQSEEGLCAALIDPSAPGVSLAPLANHADQNLWQLTLQNVHVGEDALLRNVADAWDTVMHETLVLVAAACAGGAARMLEMACMHARTREQFGQPIGAFQAIAHYLADMATDVEGARHLAWQAAWAADAGKPFHQLARQAKLQAAEVFRRATVKGVQIHGGIGFSLDADPQLYYRRARHLQLMHWDPVYLKERIAAEVFGE